MKIIILHLKKMSTGTLYRFYKSARWRYCKDAYAKSVGYLCEDCKRRGIHRTGRVCHHLIELDETNYNDPEISLNWDNLVFLCQSCHELRHSNDPRRYTFDQNGDIVIR